MKIEDIRVYAVQVPRERARPRSPEAGTEWSADGRYFRRLPYRSLYGSSAETLLVKITTDDSLTGWGEGQSPIAPEVPQKVVEQLVAPFWIGADPFDLEVLWHRTYDGLRQRGHAHELRRRCACRVQHRVVGHPRQGDREARRGAPGRRPSRARRLLCGRESADDLRAGGPRARVERERVWGDESVAGLRHGRGYRQYRRRARGRGG